MRLRGIERTAVRRARVHRVPPPRRARARRAVHAGQRRPAVPAAQSIRGGTGVRAASRRKRPRDKENRSTRLTDRGCGQVGCHQDGRWSAPGSTALPPEPHHVRDAPIRRQVEHVRALAARRPVRAPSLPVRHRRALALPDIAGARQHEAGHVHLAPRPDAPRGRRSPPCRRTRPRRSRLRSRSRTARSGGALRPSPTRPRRTRPRPKAGPRRLRARRRSRTPRADTSSPARVRRGGRGRQLVPQAEEGPLLPLVQRDHDARAPGRTGLAGSS